FGTEKSEQIKVLYWGNNQEKIREIIDKIDLTGKDEKAIFLILEMTSKQFHWFIKNRCNYLMDETRIEVMMKEKKYCSQYDLIYPNEINLSEQKEEESKIVVLNTLLLHD
ncbi:MAG: hypothetical protein ACTSP3_10120, partial [Candidatus Heimdallarchaeaceae archaeon]